MKAADIPPNGPSTKIATHPNNMWYAGEPIGGRNRRGFGPGAHFALAVPVPAVSGVVLLSDPKFTGAS